MWRYLVGGVAALMLAVAGMFLFRGNAASEPKAPPPPAPAGVPVEDAEPLPKAPRADDRTREQKRFDRVDKDRNGTITREEYLRLRKRAFAKLDSNSDGRLSFEEWAIRTTDKFAKADSDKSGTLTRPEFATTAVKRKTPVKPACVCAPPAKKADEDDGEE